MPFQAALTSTRAWTASSSFFPSFSPVLDLLLITALFEVLSYGEPLQQYCPGPRSEMVMASAPTSIQCGIDFQRQIEAFSVYFFPLLRNANKNLSMASNMTPYSFEFCLVIFDYKRILKTPFLMYEVQGAERKAGASLLQRRFKLSAGAAHRTPC